MLHTLKIEAVHHAQRLFYMYVVGPSAVAR